ncbi:MAG: TetR/AcrR family transcriptional regulator [Chloroflexi bacterium]|nr:TetR/AcrR family transcriptional regulator [Chloroflexota bacterium]
MPKRTRGRRSTEVRRTQIADAARALTVKYGSEHVTVRRIANEIGVSEGALYRHFKSKRDILSFMVERIEEDWTADMAKDGATGLTSLEILGRSLKNHVSGIEQRRGVSFQVMAEIISLGDKKLNRKAAEALDRYTARIRGILAEGIETGEVRKDLDPDSAATLIAAAIQGLVDRWALSNCSYNLEEKYESLWQTLRDILIDR